MANPKDKELSTNSEVKRTDDFQKGVNERETIIESAKELLESTTEDAFSKMGFEKVEKKAGFYGTGKSYGTGTEQNKFSVRVAGKTKASLEKQVMLGTKRVQSDINFQYNGKMVSIEYKTIEAGFFRGVDSKSIPYTFTKTISVDGSKKAELTKAMKELFSEAAKKEVGYLTNTRLGVDDKIDKGTTSTVNENKQSMKKLTLKSIFSYDENLFGTINESKKDKENIEPIKKANTIPIENKKGEFILLDKTEKELKERAEKSEMGKDEYLKFVKDEMKKKFQTSKFEELTPVEKKELFIHIDNIYTSKKEKELNLNEEGSAGVTGTASLGTPINTPYAWKKTVKETAYGKQKSNKRPKISEGYKIVSLNEGDNFWTTVPTKNLDNLKRPYIMGAPGMEGIEPGSQEELNFASKGLAKNGPKKKINESIEPIRANLDLTKKKIFSESENAAKGINKRYLVTEKTSDEYLKDRWKKLTNFKINESINEKIEINDILNECECQNKPMISYNPINTPDEELELFGNPVVAPENLEETITVQKPGSLFGTEYVFYKKDFLNENKKYILDLNSKVFIPNPNIK
jgi:hypothetical protein